MQWFGERVDEVKKKIDDHKRKKRILSKAPPPPPPIENISEPALVTPEQRASTQANFKATTKQYEAESLLKEIISYQIALENYLISELNREVPHTEKKNAFIIAQGTLLHIKSCLEVFRNDVATGNGDLAELNRTLANLKILANDTNKIARIHRENFEDHTLMWLIKFNFLRKPESFTHFTNYFEVKSEETVTPKML